MDTKIYVVRGRHEGVQFAQTCDWITRHCIKTSWNQFYNRRMTVGIKQKKYIQYMMYIYIYI